MQQYIKKLRSKSEETRKQILIWSLVVCMSLVVFIWISTLGHISKNKQQKEAINKEETSKEIKPFSMLKTSLKDTYDNVYSSVKEINFKKEEEKVEVPQTQVDLIHIEE